MPKNIDYPPASFKKAMELANAVKSLGGNTSTETCAHQMGKKVSGGFNYIISAAVKFGLIEMKHGTLSNTPRFKSISLAYDEDEKNNLIIEAFLSPPVFKGIYDKFANQNVEVPVKILDKVLIKEFEVDESKAQTVSNYFITGAKSINLMDSANLLKKVPGKDSSADLRSADSIKSDDGKVSSNPQEQNSFLTRTKLTEEKGEFVVHFAGPGMDSQIVVKEPEDLEIVEVILKKIKRKLDEREIA